MSAKCERNLLVWLINEFFNRRPGQALDELLSTPAPSLLHVAQTLKKIHKNWQTLLRISLSRTRSSMPFLSVSACFLAASNSIRKRQIKKSRPFSLKSDHIRFCISWCECSTVRMWELTHDNIVRLGDYVQPVISDSEQIIRQVLFYVWKQKILPLMHTRLQLLFFANLLATHSGSVNPFYFYFSHSARTTSCSHADWPTDKIVAKWITLIFLWQKILLCL